MSDHLSFLQPEHFLAPRGYANGVRTSGDLILVGGQVGWNAEQVFETDRMDLQFAQALDNVIAVVRAGGGSERDIASMTIFVTDLVAYRECAKSSLGTLWNQRMGRHYPAMALLGVAGLVEPQALVEIQAIAVLPRKPSS